MTAKYPTTIPAYDVLVSNLTRSFHDATPEQVVAGMTWYDEARDFCVALATASPYTLEQVIAVVAILSPGVDWRQNKKMATLYVEAHAAWINGGYVQTMKEAMPVVSAYPANREKAWLVLNGHPIKDYCRGVKVEQFAANITGDNNKVTVDRHHWTACVGTPLHELSRNGGVTAAENRVITQATLEVAANVGVAPSALQAIVWCVVRGNIGQ